MVCTPDRTQEPGHNSVQLINIALPNNILLREHFEELRVVDNAASRQVLSKNAYTQAFHWLIDGGAPKRSRMTEYSSRMQLREPIPLEGAVLVRRYEVGIPEYRDAALDFHTRTLASYGVLAGSALDAIDAQRDIWTGKLRPAAMLALTHLALQLDEQFQIP